MPLRRSLRWLYPIDWVQISQEVRFSRAKGLCQACGRPHLSEIRCLPGGRWHDPLFKVWRDGRGRRVALPKEDDLATMRVTRVVLAAAHVDHDPSNNRFRNLRSLCQRCHMLHDRPYHLAQRRLTYLRRWACGDLFKGPYPL